MSDTPAFVKCASCGVLCVPRKNGTCPKCNSPAMTQPTETPETDALVNEGLLWVGGSPSYRTMVEHASTLELRLDAALRDVESSNAYMAQLTERVVRQTEELIKADDCRTSERKAMNHPSASEAKMPEEPEFGELAVVVYNGEYYGHGNEGMTVARLIYLDDIKKLAESQTKFLDAALRERDEALKRADHAYPYPDAEDWTVEELALAYGRLKKDFDELAYRKALEISGIEEDLKIERAATVKAERDAAKAREDALEEALRCYSPDDLAQDWADKIRALKDAASKEPS